MKKQENKTEETQDQTETPEVEEQTPEQPEQRAIVSITHLGSGVVWKLGELPGQVAENLSSMVDTNAQTGNATRFQVKTGEIIVVPGTVIADCVVTIERTQ